MFSRDFSKATGFLFLPVIFFFLLIPLIPAKGSELTYWNEKTLEGIRKNKTPPPQAARVLSMVHGAIFDAVNSIARTYTPYRFSLPVPRQTSQEAAVISAAYEILSHLYPQNQQQWEEAFKYRLSLRGEGKSREEQLGLLLGQKVAISLLETRQSDPLGDQMPAEAPERGAGIWNSEHSGAGANTRYLLPGWGNIPPFIVPENLLHPDDIPGPPALNSEKYRLAFEEVKSLGSKNSTTRTAEQTEIAFFWSDGPGTSTPPGHWNMVAQTIVKNHSLSLVEEARLFALLNLSMADALICCWGLKWKYFFWRPITAIREAELDGHPDTQPDTKWAPLIPTPPFPGYTSGHSSLSGAAAQVLTLLISKEKERESMAFSVTSDGLPGVQRSFRNFHQAAQEAAQSRIYGGIHFSFESEDGLNIGQSIGDHIVKNYLKPR